MSSQKLNQNVMLPLDNYIARCTGDEFGRSNSSDNPMLTLQFELVTGPEGDEIEIAGEKYNIAGARTQPKWLVTQVFEEGSLNTEKSAKCLENLKNTYVQFGLDVPEVNPESPARGFKGKLVHVRAYGKEEAVRKAPTAEEKKAGKQGAIVKNPITGKDVIKYVVVISEIYGPAQADPSKPY